MTNLRALAVARCRCAMWRVPSASFSSEAAAGPPSARLRTAASLQRTEQPPKAAKPVKVNFGLRRRSGNPALQKLLGELDDEDGPGQKMTLAEMRAQAAQWEEEMEEVMAADAEEDEREYEKQAAIRSRERPRGRESAPAGTPPRERQRLIEVSILGAPNAGKSTLLNTIIGKKVSIVAPKVQTTREQVLGVHVDGDVQMLFYDTPGIVRPETQKDLARPLTKSPWQSLWESDVALLLVDSSRHLDLGVRHAVERMAKEAAERREAERERRARRAAEEGGEEDEEDEEAPFRVALVLNKVDQLKDKTRLLTLATEVHALAERAAAGRPGDPPFFEETFMVSASTGDGVGAIAAYLAGKAPLGEWAYPLGTKTDLGPKEQVKELLREKLLRFFNKEIPYIVEQDTVHWDEPSGPKGPLLVKQALHVARESQRELLMGKGGGTMARLRERAEADVRAALGREVRLDITVKIRPSVRR